MNPWLPMAPCSPGACVGPPVVAVGRVRQAARLAAAVVVLLAGVALAPVASWMGTARRARLTRRWARMLLKSLGVRVSICRGFGIVGGSARARAVPEEIESGSLLVANHVSWLDPLVVAATVPARLLAKREIRGWPLIGALAACSGALFIDRNRLTALPEAVGEVAATLTAGDSVVAFPEGTTWCGREMGAFRPAVFQAALDAGVPVRPMALRFTDEAGVTTGACYVGDDTLIASLLRVTAMRGLVAEVTLFPGVRLAPTGRRCEARKALARIAEDQVRTSVAGTHPMAA